MKAGPRYYDRQGRPIEMMSWAYSLEDLERRRVAWTLIDVDAYVSTVWLGLDHNWGQGRPLIFETMVFGGLGDGEQDRYSTEDEAQRGHQAMCERWSL